MSFSVFEVEEQPALNASFSQQFCSSLKMYLSTLTNKLAARCRLDRVTCLFQSKIL